jgi:hypothetical protein
MTSYGIGGISLHVIIAVLFAIHAIRTGRELYWLLILFLFPLLGSLVYFFAVFLPDLRAGLRLQYGLRKVANAAVASIDPGRELRDAKSAFDQTPTAKNQWRYATALLAAHRTEEACTQFDQCLTGPAGSDLEIQFAAANAYFQFEQYDKALDVLLAIRKSNPSFRVEAVTMLLAKLYALKGNHDAAATEFEVAITRFGSVEARVECAMWYAKQGDIAKAQALRDELEELKQHWTKQSQAQYLPLLEKLNRVM